MAFKIYTKTGDKGLTSLIGGVRVPKNHLRIEAYGTLDELNSWIGLIMAQMPIAADQYSIVLNKIQNELFVIGSLLAAEGEVKMKLPTLAADAVQEIERTIDAIDAQLPPLSSFVLPGGSILIGNTHVARCVCRRAERLVVALAEHADINPLLLIYLNRLSDFLFTLARYFHHVLNIPEIPWVPIKA